LTQPTKLAQIAAHTLNETPRFADATLELAHDKLKNKRARGWLKAIHKAGIKPSIFLARSGLLDWARQESATVIGELQKLMEGEPLALEISIDLRGFKAAVGAKRADGVIKRIMAQLPKCTVNALRDWQQLQLSSRKRPRQLPPACHPGKILLPSLLRSKRLALYHMPRRIYILPQQPKDHPLRSWITGIAHVPWLLFALPMLLILLGAAVGGAGLRGFCQWSGGATLLGGLLALPTPFLLKDVLLKAYLLTPWQANLQAELPIHPKILHHWLHEHTLPFFRGISAPLFSSVETVALIICIAGIGLLGLGSIFPERQDE